jgi:hypothetical protein
LACHRSGFSRKPVATLLEDLHWFDPGSEAFLQLLVETATVKLPRTNERWTMDFMSDALANGQKLSRADCAYTRECVVRRRYSLCATYLLPEV